MADLTQKDAAQLRLAALVMAATGVLWLAANWAGQRYGWPSKYAFLADLAAMGGFVSLERKPGKRCRPAALNARPPFG